jgi:hypothetical protein
MELLAIAVMLAGGAALAGFVLVAYAIGRADREKGQAPGTALPDHDRVAASILFHLLVLGGTPAERALGIIREQAGLMPIVTRGIDLRSWAERYAQFSSGPEKERFLETVVRSITAERLLLPLPQYTGLLDLSFALGFQTDALFRLRERIPFEYVDHAKNARPRAADRGGGGAPLYVRDASEGIGECLRVLEMEGNPSRHEIITAYRRMAARYHPDRHFEAGAEAQQEAAAKFIEVTRAYERLLTFYQ